MLTLPAARRDPEVVPDQEDRRQHLLPREQVVDVRLRVPLRCVEGSRVRRLARRV